MILLDILQCIKEAVIGSVFIFVVILLPIGILGLIKRRRDKKFEDEYRKFMDEK